jgi:RNA polymerase sigma-70 factor (ECF subfamily)
MSVELSVPLSIEHSFEELFKTHFQGLSAYARTILRDEEAAEEVVQQVFVRLWEKRTALQIDKSMQSYLYRSVYNESMNQLKHREVRRAHAQYVLAGGEPEHADSRSLSYRELQLRLNEALNKLPEQCRTIFQLSRFEDLKYREIADRLNLSVKTVENQMGKALRIMRSELTDFLPLFLFLFINN